MWSSRCSQIPSRGNFLGRLAILFCGTRSTPSLARWRRASGRKACERYFPRSTTNHSSGVKYCAHWVSVFGSRASSRRDSKVLGPQKQIAGPLAATSNRDGGSDARGSSQGNRNIRKADATFARGAQEGG